MLQDSDLSFFKPRTVLDEAARAAGKSMANRHSEEVYIQMRNGAMDVKRKLHQAEVTVHDVVHHAECELVAKTEAQNAASSMSGQPNMLRSDMAEVMKIHQSQSSNMSRLERDNAELRNRPTAVGGIASVLLNHHSLLVMLLLRFMELLRPPRMGGNGNGPPDDDDPDDDDDSDGDHKKKKTKDKNKQNNKRDSTSFSSSSIGISKKELLQMLKKVSKSKEG